MIRETIIGSICVSVFALTMALNPFEQSKGELLTFAVAASMLCTTLALLAFRSEDMYEKKNDACLQCRRRIKHD